jgi:hypothetical protein
MIGELRRGLRIDPVKKLQDRLQALESEGDRMLLVAYRTLYVEGATPCARCWPRICSS